MNRHHLFFPAQQAHPVAPSGATSSLRSFHRKLGSQRENLQTASVLRVTPRAPHPPPTPSGLAFLASEPILSHLRIPRRAFDYPPHPSLRHTAPFSQAQAGLFALEQSWLKTFVPNDTAVPLIRGKGDPTKASEPTDSQKQLAPAPAAVVHEGGLTRVKKEIAGNQADATGTRMEEGRRLCTDVDAPMLLSPAARRDSVGREHNIMSVGMRQIRYHPAAAPASDRPAATNGGGRVQAWVGGVAGEDGRTEGIQRRDDKSEADMRIDNDGVGWEELQACHDVGGSGQRLQVLTPPPASPPARSQARPPSSDGDRKDGDSDGGGRDRMDLDLPQELHKHRQYRCDDDEHGVPPACSEYGYGRPCSGQGSGIRSPAEHPLWQHNQPGQSEGGGDRFGGEVSNQSNTVAPAAVAATASAGDAIHDRGGGCDSRDTRPGFIRAADFPGWQGGPAQTQVWCPRFPFKAGGPYGPEEIASYNGPGRGYDEEHPLRRYVDWRIGVGPMAGAGVHPEQLCGEHRPIDQNGADLHHPATGYLDSVSRYQAHFIANGGSHLGSGSSSSSIGWGPAASAAASSGHPDMHIGLRGGERRTGPFRLERVAPPPVHLRTCNQDHLFFPGDTQNLRAVRQDFNPHHHIQAAAMTGPQQLPQYNGELGRRAAVKSEPP